MQKSTLETFIKRYSLEGICEPAHWYSDAAAQTLTAKAHTETKTVILKVVMKDWQGVESCQLALPSSSKVRKMLGPIGDDITISLTKVRDRVANIVISDQDCEAVVTVAEFDAFPESLDCDTAELPTSYEVEMELTEEFIGRLMKSISALAESKDFVLLNNKKGGLDMVINYEDTNTNRIRIPVVTLPGKDKIDIPMGFSTEVLKAIVAANQKHAKSRLVAMAVSDGPGDDSPKTAAPPPEKLPILKVSSRGIAVIGYEDDIYKSTYFLFPTRVIE